MRMDTPIKHQNSKSNRELSVVAPHDDADERTTNNRGTTWAQIFCCVTRSTTVRPSSARFWFRLGKTTKETDAGLTLNTDDERFNKAEAVDEYRYVDRGCRRSLSGPSLIAARRRCARILCLRRPLACRRPRDSSTCWDQLIPITRARCVSYWISTKPSCTALSNPSTTPTSSSQWSSKAPHTASTSSSDQVGIASCF